MPKNPRDRRVYKAAYDAANKEKYAAYRELNKERLADEKAEWYRANRERVLARVKANSEMNRERILAYQAEYYAANTEKVKATVSAYRKANPEKKQHFENTRRARKAGNGGAHTLVERQDKFDSIGNVCFYCGQDGKLSIDHVLPLARGGTNDIENILPACKSCNSRKHTRTGQEFMFSIYFGRTNHQKTGGVLGGDVGR